MNKETLKAIQIGIAKGINDVKLAEQPAQQQEPISKLFGTLPVYDKPTQASKPWVGLTDDEILYCVELENPKAIAEKVEAKLKEKNT